MLPTPCYVFGDAHLGIAPQDAERALLDFLRMVKSRGRSLVIMGDLFDFWFAWRYAMPRCGYRVLAALADLRDADVDVLWLGGNHDCWSGDALALETGAQYTLDPWHDNIGEWRVHLAHGDGLRPREDARYRRLRSVLRHPLSARAFRWLHPDLATRVALSSSHTSRVRRAGDGGRGLLAIASAALSEAQPPNLVIHGHSHVPLLHRAGGGWYANAGAWYMDRQFFRLDDTTITQAVWSGSGEGEVVAVGHRVQPGVVKTAPSPPG